MDALRSRVGGVSAVAACIVGCVLTLVMGCAPRPAGVGTLVWFDTEAGSTWSFSKTVSGGTREGNCDGVVIESSLGSTRAVLQRGRFTAQVGLRGGENRLVAVCMQGGRARGRSPAQSWNVRAREAPRAWIRMRIVGRTVELDAEGSGTAPGTSAALSRFDWRVRGGDSAAVAVALQGQGQSQGQRQSQGRSESQSQRREPGQGQGQGQAQGQGQGQKQIAFTAPAVDGVYFVTLRVTDTLGRSDESTTEFRVVNSQPMAVDRRATHPAWWNDAVVYGLSPAFFAGGDYASVAAHLDQIAKLGATVVWLSPVTEAPPNDFGYAVTDPFALRRTFGTQAQFRALLSEAHRRGLRVMLDLVTNHLARQSSYFADTARRGRKSPYYAWFERDARGEPVHYFDWANLENLNYDDPEVRDFTTAALAGWVRDYAVDGMRLDAIWALRERAPGLLTRVMEEVERIDPDVALLAEASAADPYYSRQGFDGAYDWTANLGQWAWHDIFGAPGSTADVRGLRQALLPEVESEQGAVQVLHFINNNDTGERFITRHGAQQARIAAVLLFTLPGVPLIYAGDEVGAEFEPYNLKAPVDWSDRYALQPLYRRLTQLRQGSRALREGRMTLVPTDQDDRVLAFVRAPDPGEVQSPAADDGPWLIVINFSGSPVRVQLHPAGPVPCGAERCSVLDPLDETRTALSIGAHGHLFVPGYGAVMAHRSGRQ